MPPELDPRRVWLLPCGTFAAYRRHLRVKETPCEPCKQAARDQANARYDSAAAKARYAARKAASTPASTTASTPERTQT
jgi:hypothetical protein